MKFWATLGGLQREKKNLPTAISMQLFGVVFFNFLWAKKSKYFFLKIYIKIYKKLKKPPSKVAQKNSNPIFSLRPKEKNSCSKMWLIDQLFIELGPTPNALRLLKV